MDELAPAARRLWVYVACLVSAALLYPITLFSIRDMMIEPGNVGSSALLGVSEFLLWLVLIAFVYAASARAPSTPLIHAVRAWVALGGALASLYAVSGPDNAIWVWTTPWLMPPLAALFGLGAIWRRNAPVKISHRVAIGFAAISLPLIAAPFVQMANYDPAAAEAKALQREAASDAAFLRAVDEIDPRSGLDPYLSYLNMGETLGDALRQRAIGRIRTVPSRQADTIRLLGRGFVRDLSALWRFDLAATEPLCRAYGAALYREIAVLARQPNWSNLSVVLALMPQERNISWLARERCDLTRPLAWLAEAGRTLEPRFQRAREFAARLETLLRPEAPPAT